MINKQALKIGFIGGGINSAVGLTHKIASQIDNKFKLVAGCFSRNQEINNKTAQSWCIKPDRLYSDWEKLLEYEKGKLDAVVILTPTTFHTEIILKAISLGYPIICEKALAPTTQEAEKISELVNKYNGFLAVTYNYTGYPMVRELKILIEQGKLGKLNQVHIEMPQEGFLRLDKNGQKPKPQVWRLEDNTIPTLSLDLGVHIHNMVNFISNQKPIEIVAINNNFGFFKKIVDNTLCIAHYTSDLHSQIWYGKTALGQINGLRIRVYGAKGSAEWFQMQPDSLVLHDNLGNKNILERSSVSLEIAGDLRYNRFKAGHPSGFIEAFANHYYDIALALHEYIETGKYNSQWVFGANMAIEGLHMLETIAKSAKNRTWEKIKSS